MFTVPQFTKMTLAWVGEILLATNFQSGFAQKNEPLKSVTTPEQPYPKHHVYINFLGDASLISLNYDHMWRLRNAGDFKQFISTKIGIGRNREFTLNFSSTADRYITLPHHVTYNMGTENAHFEIGLGGTRILDDLPEYILYPTIGGRIVSKSYPHFSFRLYCQVPVNRFYDFYSNAYFIPIGTSLGIAF